MNNIKRESPNMFDENHVMIGRNKTDMIWKKFKWGEKMNNIWEYCPLTHLNKHLVGTKDDYYELDESSVLKYKNDVEVNDTKEDADKVFELVNGLTDTQLGICAMYACYKYSNLVKNKFFTLADNYRNVVVNIMSNEEFKIYNDALTKMMNKDGKTV